ncbi:MAG: DUF1232 domain-containing protein [Deltaproteobacteria bacterium]|nr:DUF1232 domain-containing protein [Deltaproteobacteria bacterium]
MSPERKQWLFRTAVLWLLDSLYTVSPIDLIPDAIPVLGQMDDLFFFGLAVFYTWRTFKATGLVPTGLPSEAVLRGEVEAALSGEVSGAVRGALGTEHPKAIVDAESEVVSPS